MSSELNVAVEKFLETRGIKTEQADAPEPAISGKNLLIGVPAFGGQIHTTTATLLLDLGKVLPIPHTTFFLAGESLIPRARNHIASIAAFGKDGAGREFSDLLFLDSDLSFRPEYVLQMLKCDLPIVALPYARKSFNWKFICEAAKHGIRPEHLDNFGGMANLGVEKEFAISESPAEVKHAATGAMLIRTSVLKALAEAHQRRYRPNCDFGEPRLEFHHDFFRVGVRRGVYVSEDYSFCEDAAELGFKTHILPAAKTFHHGSMSFPMDMSAVAAVASVIVREQEQANAEE
jgi:hypothetical protein